MWVACAALGAWGCGNDTAGSKGTGADGPPMPDDPIERGLLASGRHSRPRLADTCEPGEYLASEDATGERTCAPCEAGSYSTSANASECQPWSTCRPGQYVEREPSRSADRVCADCSADTHSTRVNSPRCVPEDECEPGTQAVDGVCEACEAGTYSGAPHQACTACEPGSYCPPGSSEPQICGDGTWDDDDDPSTACQSQGNCQVGSPSSDQELSLGEWYHQLGQHGGESAGDLVADAAGNVYVAAQTIGDVDGSGSRGKQDVFVRKLSSAEGTEIWRVQLGSTENESAESIALAPDGALVIAGWTSGDLAGTGCPSESTAFVHKLSASDGAPLWTVQLEWDGVGAVDVSTDGDIAVSGSLNDHAIVTKMSADGTTLWQATLEESTYGGYGVSFDSAGNLAVTFGKSFEDEDDYYDYYTPSTAHVRLMSGDSGTELWTTTLDFDHRNYAGKIRSDGAGSFVVSAASLPNDDLDVGHEHVVLLDSQTGDIAWSRAYDYDSPTSASFHSGGDVLVQNEWGVQRLSRQDGAELWTSGGVSGSDSVTGAVGTPSGDVVILGENHPSIWTAWLDGNDGSAQWRDNFTTSHMDELHSVAFDPEGDVVVGGRTETTFERVPPNDSPDALVRKLSGATGEPLWTRQFGSDGFDDIFAVGADSSGDVVVGGAVTVALPANSPHEWDAFIGKLSGVDGSTLWSTQFGSADSDLVSALAVDALGDIVVTVEVSPPEPVEDPIGSAYVRKVSGVDGGSIWETSFGSGGQPWTAPAVGFMPNGDVVAARIASTDRYSRVVRLSGADGSVVWTVDVAVEPDTDGLGSWLSSLAVDAAGNIALLVDRGFRDALVKLSGEDGSELWTTGASGAAVAFDLSGDILVAGSDVVRYASGDGTSLGALSSYFGEPQNMALAVSASGDVVLAGSTWANVSATERYLDLDGFVLKLRR